MQVTRNFSRFFFKLNNLFERKYCTELEPTSFRRNCSNLSSTRGQSFFSSDLCEWKNHIEMRLFVYIPDKAATKAS